MAKEILSALSDATLQLWLARPSEGRVGLYASPNEYLETEVTYLLDAITSACEGSLKSLEASTTDLMDIYGKLTAEQTKLGKLMSAKAFKESAKPKLATVLDEMSELFKQVEKVSIVRATLPALEKLASFRKALADAKSTLERDFTQFDRSATKLSKRAATVAEAVSQTVDAVASQRGPSVTKISESLVFAVSDLIERAQKAYIRNRAVKEAVSTVESLVVDLDAALVNLSEPKRAWERLNELDAYVQQSLNQKSRITPENKDQALSDYVSILSAYFHELRGAVEREVSEAEKKIESAGGKDSEKGHVIHCAVENVNNVSRALFSAVEEFLARIKSRGVFAKDIIRKIDRRAQQLHQALLRLTPPSTKQIKKQNLVENIKELEKLTEILSNPDLKAKQRADTIDRINNLLLLVDTQARVNAHHDKADPDNQQRVHLILNNLERSIRKLDALSKANAKEKEIAEKKQRVHRKLNRLGRHSKAITNAAVEFVAEVEHAQVEAAEAIKKGDKKKAKRAAHAVVEDITKLAELATAAHGDDKEVAAAVENAQKAVKALEASAEGSEDGAEMEDVNLAVEAAAKLSQQVAEAENRDAEAENLAGSGEEDDGEDFEEKDKQAAPGGEDAPEEATVDTTVEPVVADEAPQEAPHSEIASIKVEAEISAPKAEENLKETPQEAPAEPSAPEERQPIELVHEEKIPTHVEEKTEQEEPKQEVQAAPASPAPQANVAAAGKTNSQSDGLQRRTMSRFLSTLKVSADKPVEEVISEVAEMMDESIQATQDTTEAHKIADSLRNLAVQSRAGSREETLAAAKQLSADLTNLVKKSREFVKNDVKDVPKNLKQSLDTLVQAAEALSNYATQVRIMVNVRAGHKQQQQQQQQGNDEDQALGQLAKSIGIAVRDITLNKDQLASSSSISTKAQ